MVDYIRREDCCEENCGKENREGYKTCTNCGMLNVPSTDVQPVSRWISVEERLPEENQKCLVYRDINADLKITTGIWHSEWKAFDGLRHGTRLEDTIAWMPLPEPPKEGDTNE